ncbi:unnamed protein product [Phytomonas sp. Hart1]|nr:unnamed protein product [Phytomonas sp. Hart1]|eukprot:CCW71777.1 unnamed protein product [Phytomonas sp. isolate Hart1]
MEVDANLAPSVSGRGGNPSPGGTSPIFALGSPSSSAPYSGGAPDDVDVAIGIFEQNVKFMTFFYQHLTASPPHGPFRYYAAITLVERAKERFGRRRGLRGGASSHSQVLTVLTVRNVLALIERKYNTRHLSSWPLLYVPAEVHATDLQREG